MHNPFTNNIVKKVNPKLKAVLIKSVDSPAVKVVFGSSDLCVFVCVPDRTAVAAAICLQSGKLIDFLPSMCKINRTDYNTILFSPVRYQARHRLRIPTGVPELNEINI